MFVSPSAVITPTTPTTCAICAKVRPWERTVSIFVTGLEVAICGPCHYKLNHKNNFDSLPTLEG